MFSNLKTFYCYEDSEKEKLIRLTLGEQAATRVDVSNSNVCCHEFRGGFGERRGLNYANPLGTGGQFGPVFVRED